MSVGKLRAAGFSVLATGSHVEHFDILLVAGHLSTEPLAPLAELVDSARHLLAVCGEMRPNPSYAGGADG